MYQHRKIIRAFFLFLALVFTVSPRAQESNRPFRIGFLISDEEPGLSLQWFESLKRFLLEQPTIQRLLAENHYSGIAILPADGYRDMLQRMDLNEFDLAFCSSVIFVEQHGDYRSILQIRGDIYDSRGQGMTLHKGGVIAGPKCTLFQQENRTPEKIRTYVMANPIAFVSAHNATGYVYPRLALWRKYNVAEPGDVIFTGSSEEVVKYVVNGLVNIGACDSNTMETLLKTACPQEIPGKKIQVLFETPPAPTNPIVVRLSLHPQKSELGREVKQALKFFCNNSRRPGVPRVADSRDENFKNLREEIAAFHALIDKSSKQDTAPPPGKVRRNE